MWIVSHLWCKKTDDELFTINENSICWVAKFVVPWLGILIIIALKGPLLNLLMKTLTDLCVNTLKEFIHVCQPCGHWVHDTVYMLQTAVNFSQSSVHHFDRQTTRSVNCHGNQRLIVLSHSAVFDYNSEHLSIQIVCLPDYVY